MNPVNRKHIPIPEVKRIFRELLVDEYISPNGVVDISINNPLSNFKLLHHLLIGRFSRVVEHHRDTPIPLIGLDIETDHTTGEPRLMGFSYSDDFYHPEEYPTLDSLFRLVTSTIQNSPDTQFVTWGNLDINCIIRLFDPTDSERKRISRGISGKFRNGKWLNFPPLMRPVLGGLRQFCIDHYIPGRSLRLGIVDSGHYHTVWVYNLSQFYETTIRSTARAMGLEWQDYDENTHLIDWRMFDSVQQYKNDCLASNEQDARTVRLMARNLQEIFYKVFDAYPALLVSAGSLADASVSKELDMQDYAANSWNYLKYSVFGGESEDVTLAECLLSEAYSAGYVDQFAIGYFPELHTADISSAYPHKIRQLPDLRYCELHVGSGDPTRHIKQLEKEDRKVFTAAIRGRVTIPENLQYHPITTKTPQKQNIRPIGTFQAAYLLEEREFCEKYGAKFEREKYVIFALTEYHPAPIARVSMKLAELRDNYRKLAFEQPKESDEYRLYDAMQYRVKVIDNSLYGKTVATTEIIELNESGDPDITGYKAGDRFNMLYGSWITALTRVQLAQACMSITENGGNPVMAMTDSVYWQGRLTDLPDDVIAQEKTAGYFEPPHSVQDFYLVKTGQYEFRYGDNWYHKMRGLNVPYEDRVDSESFYRKLICDFTSGLSPYAHPEDIEIPVNTRKLITVGSHDLDHLGLVSDGTALLRPFVLSAKQIEPFVMDWPKTLNGSIRLAPPTANNDETPYQLLSGLYQNGHEQVTRHQRKRILYLLTVKYTGMHIGNRFNGKMPEDKHRLSEISWDELQDWGGIKREWAKI